MTRRTEPAVYGADVADPSTTRSAAGRRRGQATTGDATKSKIIDAALACLAEDGIVGVSARAIARHGDFNQALIFYHFGSVDGLLVATALTESRRRAERYADRLRAVETVPQLIAMARELYELENNANGTGMLVQMMAGAASSEELREGISQGFTPWMELVEDTLTRILAPTPLAGLVSVADLSLTIASLFLGLQLIVGVQQDAERIDELFASLEMLGTLVEALIQMVPAVAPAPTTPPSGG